MENNIIYGYGMPEPQQSALSEIEKGVNAYIDEQTAPIDEERMRILDLYKASRIEADEPIEATDFLFAWNGVDFMPRKNLASLKAPAKTGKTFALTAFVTAFCKGEYQGLRCYATPTERVLFVDTEQSRNSTKKVLRRIISNAPNAAEKVIMLNIRTTEAADRIRLIDLAVQEVKPTLVIVDGIADLVPGMDYNDSEKADAVITRLAQIAEENNAVVLTAIHTNKNDNHASGWLGKILLQKCAVEMAMTREKGKTTRKIEFTAVRDREVSDINVDIEDTPDGYGRIVIIPTEKAESDKMDEQRNASRLKLIDLGIESQTAPRASFLRLYMAKAESAGLSCTRQAANNFITRCIKCGALVERNGLYAFEY